MGDFSLEDGGTHPWTYENLNCKEPYRLSSFKDPSVQKDFYIKIITSEVMWLDSNGEDLKKLYPLEKGKILTWY